MAEQLHDITLRVVPGSPFPAIGRPMSVDSAIHGRIYEIVPKRIVCVRWGKDGAVIVELKATRKRIEEAPDNG